MKPNHLIILLNSLFIVSCNDGGSIEQQLNPKKHTTEKRMKQHAEVLKLVKHKVMDRDGTGDVASTFLIPEDWKVQDKLYWEYGDATVPVRFKSLMQNGDKSMQIQSYPDVRTYWTTGPTGTAGRRPPENIIMGMKDLIKVERRGMDISYVKNKILSDQHKDGYQQGGEYQSESQSGVIKIEYEENGEEIEEEFYGQLDVTKMNTAGAMGEMKSIVWAASSLYSLNAVKGKLNQCRAIAQTINSSTRMTKPFFNTLAQVIQLLSDNVYKRIYEAGQISKIISATNDRMIANIDAQYRAASEASSRINQNFSDYIRGVDSYDDGNGRQIQLPSGYDNAWVNTRGEYIISNTPGYDPSADNDGNWTQLERH